MTAMNKELSLVYAAKITQEEGGYTVTFRDLENVFTEGDTYEEALFNAREVLDLLLLDMAPEVAVPVLLHKLRVARHTSMAEVARSMGVSYQSYQQIEAGKNITLKSLKRAAAALGAIVEIRLYPAVRL